MGITAKKIDDGAIPPVKMLEKWRTGQYVYERFDMQPSCALAANGFADPTSAGPNRVLGRNGFHATYTGIVTQTILVPVYDATKGLDVSQDQTDDDGVQYVFGSRGTVGAFCHTVGTTPDSFVKLTFRIADVSGTDDCFIGWCKNEAVQAAIDDYDELAGVNVISGDVKIETILNNATTTTTDSGQNWLDDETHSIEVQIRGRRVVYLFDGSPLTLAPEFSFDNGEVLNPIFYFLQAATTPGKVWWTAFECGPIAARDTNAAANPL